MLMDSIVQKCHDFIYIAAHTTQVYPTNIYISVLGSKHTVGIIFSSLPAIINE